MGCSSSREIESEYIYITRIAVLPGERNVTAKSDIPAETEVAKPIFVGVQNNTTILDIRTELASQLSWSVDIYSTRELTGQIRLNDLDLASHWLECQLYWEYSRRKVTLSHADGTQSGRTIQAEFFTSYLISHVQSYAVSELGQSINIYVMCYNEQLQQNEWQSVDSAKTIDELYQWGGYSAEQGAPLFYTFV